MPNQIEPSVNNALGILLQGMLSRSHVRSENTQTFEGHPGMHPDILVTAPGSAPVVLEAEYLPALTAEAEAKDRLGLVVAETGRPIEAVIALRYPEELGDADDLAAALKDARLASLPRLATNLTASPRPAGWRGQSKTWPTWCDLLRRPSGRCEPPQTRLRRASSGWQGSWTR